MHEYLKQAREGAAKKLKGIQSGEPHTKVDSSSWSPPEMLEADKQNGMRPVSPRQYKSGGKVHGVHAKKRADRKARKEGGRAMSVDGFINRDNKMANDERAGVKKVGGMKRGGRTHKAMAGAVGDAPIAGAPLAGRPMRGMRPIRPMMARPPVGVAPGMAGKPMMKKGGKVHREHHADGDVVGDMIRQDQIEQGMKGRGLPERVPMPTPRPADKANIVKRNAPIITEKRGGKVRAHHAKGGAAHPDEAEDKALIKKMIKSSAMKRDEHCWGGEAKSKKADGGATEAQRVGAASSKFYKEGNKPAVQSTKSSDFDAMRNADRNLTTALEQQGYKKGGRTKHASGGEAGRGLYVRQGYPHEVPGVDGGRVARKHGGSAKGKTNVNIMIHPHSGMSQPPMMPPMGGPAMPPPPPPRPQMPPMGGMPMGAPMGGGAPALPPMGAARPGMPPIGRKSGGKVEHVIDHAAGGGLGRLEKIKAYGLE
jgi:hypothetical protein